MLLFALLAGATPTEAQTPPYVKVSPGNSTILGTSTVDVTIDYCYTDAVGYGDPKVRVNSVDVTSSASISFITPPAGCDQAQRATITVNAPATVEGRYNTYGTNYLYNDVATYEVPRAHRDVRVQASAQLLEPRSGSAFGASYTVVNTGAAADTFTVGVSCGGAGIAGGCTASPSTVSLGSGASTTVNVLANAGYSAGARAMVSMTATALSDAAVADSTWSEVVVAAPPTSGVRVATTEDVDRASCPSIAVASNAAHECGDLRIVHSLPATTRFNRIRTPSLLYSAQTASPVPMVTVDVTPSTSRAAVTVCVSVPAVSASQCVSGSGQAAGETRRFSIPLLGWTAPTGRYAFTVSSLGLVYTPFPTYTSIGSASGAMAVVNRSSSPYGAGWWLTGIDQVVGNPAVDDTLLWVGADASTRMFASAGTIGGVERFVARSLDRPDTIHYTGTTLYRRQEDGRHTTYFSPGTGYYSYTVSSFGQTLDACTTMLVGGGCQVWDMGAAYTLAFTSGRLDSILAPTAGAGVRRVTLAWNGARLAGITDPDGKSIGFQYDSSSAVIAKRVDKRLKVTHFVTGMSRLLSVTRDSVSSGLNLQTTFIPAENRAVGGIAPRDAHTLIDGPRTDVDDVTQVWTSPQGALLRVRDAHGRETEVQYDSTWTLLVRRTRNPLRLLSEAFYNGRGLPDSVRLIGRRGATDTTLTRYRWDPVWRSAVSVRDAAGVLDSTSVDAMYGVPLWQQRGTSSGRRVSFGYITSGPAAGQVRTVTRPPSNATDSLFYDASGNLARTRSALGFLSLVYRDAAGRDTTHIEPIDSADALDSITVHAKGMRATTRFDAMGRVSEEWTAGPSRSTSRTGTHPADTLRIAHGYDDEGNRTLTTKSYRQQPGAAFTNLYHSWSYDAVGRPLTESRPGASSSTFAYDSAGNLRAVTSGRGHTISSQYDALGRIMRRVVPQVTYGSQHCSLFPTQSSLCMYSFPTRLSGVCIPADTMRYRYDAAGNLVNADNRWARVRRTHTAAGLVTTDTLRTRAWYVRTNDGCEEPDPLDAGTSYATRFATHVYGIGYTYDVAGRLDTLKHPDAIDPCSGRCVQRYAYHGQTGLLDAVVDFAGRTHSFSYDDGGRLTAWTAPGGFADSRGYDLDDRLVRRTLTALVADTMSLDAQGRIRVVRSGYPFGHVAAVQYNGLGAVIESDNLGDGTIDEDFRVDAAGNRQFQARRTSRFGGHADRDRMRLHAYDGGGRLWRTVDSLTVPSLGSQYDYEREQQFDESGNVTWRGEHEHDFYTGEWYDGLRMYYGADDRLAVANRHLGISAVSDDSRPGARAVWEMHRYDALGRRVATHAVRGSACPASASECASYVERTVWDGAGLLYELRTPDTTPLNDLAAGGTYHAFGRVGYLHAGAIDAPLAVTRIGLSGQPAEVTVAPHAGWQGAYVGGSLMSGASQGGCTGASGCPLIDWPGATQTVDGVVVSPASNAWWGRLIAEQADASGLKYQRNRFYDPTTGQFTQQDPIGLAGGANLYAFAGGDPVNYRDPFGLCKESTALCQFIMGVGRRVAPLDAAGESVARFGLDVSGVNDVTDAIGRRSVVSGMLALASMLPAGRLARVGKFALLRTEARNLAEQLVMAEAKAGSGFEIMTGKIQDSRFATSVWAKMSHTHRLPDGQTIEIHYWKNRETRATEGFKFKNP